MNQALDRTMFFLPTIMMQINLMQILTSKSFAHQKNYWANILETQFVRLFLLTSVKDEGGGVENIPRGKLNMSCYP